MSDLKKKKKKKSGGGLSFGTVLLILLTAAVVILCVALICGALAPGKKPSPSLPDSTKTSGESGDSVVSFAGPSDSRSSLPSAGSFSSHSPFPESSPAESPSPFSTPGKISPSSSKDAPVDRVYLKVPGESDMKTLRVTKDGTVCTVLYYVPVVCVPFDMAVEQRINSVLENETDKIIKSVKRNFERNIGESTDSFSRTLELEFYKGESCLSVVMRYPVIAGLNGEIYTKVTSFNFNAFTGEDMKVLDVLADRSLAADYVKLNIEGGNDPDFSILREGEDFCDGWYVHGEKLTVLYNGKSIDALYPGILSVELPEALFRKP